MNPVTQVIETIDVDVPVRTAYNQWTQFESFPHFLDFVESITQQDDTHTHWKVKIGGAEREFDAEITEQHPDERVAWKSISGDEKHAGVVTFHRLSDTTSRVTVQLDWEAEGFLEKVGAVFGVDDHVIRKDLKQFKTFVENPANQAGGWRGDVSV
ncbi:putative membrane protein [Cryobacterium sp. MP_3.1]|nr:putative membrane protein [Cryobacterium sp. MP_3.1]